MCECGESVFRAPLWLLGHDAPTAIGAQPRLNAVGRCHLTTLGAEKTLRGCVILAMRHAQLAAGLQTLLQIALTATNLQLQGHVGVIPVMNAFQKRARIAAGFQLQIALPAKCL